MKRHTIEELNRLYNDGDAADASHFAEQRTNTLLFVGDHYRKTAKDFVDRNGSKLSEDTKIKLQENHIQLVSQRYINGILQQAPGCTVAPYNENELADQKDAELSLAVQKDGESRQGFEEKTDKWAQSLVVNGECVSFTYWAPNKGKFLGYEQEVDESGAPLFEHPEFGAIPHATHPDGTPLPPKASERPVFEGELVSDFFHPFNLIRHKAAENMEDSPFICLRKMVAKDEAEAMVTDEDPDEKKKKLEYIVESSKSTFKIFDGDKGSYAYSDGQIHLRYFFFRPCYDYPEGYFYVATEAGVLNENKLPYGVWPIAFSGFRECPTSPRFKSIIRDLKHPQLQLNYLISKSAYHVAALGDDKVFTQMGSKISKGSTWAGLREFQVNGQAPTVIEGRAGSQFESSIARQVATIWKLADLEYDLQQSPGGQDLQAMLYAKSSQKAKFNPYARKFERFLVKTWEIYLELAKHYFTDQRIIMAVGRREAINIAEFKNTTERGYRIKIKASNTDVDSQFGKSVHIRELLQYAGKDIPPSMLGRLIKDHPFLNADKLASDLTIDEENIDSDILALDRGEMRPANPSDKHDFYIKRLEHRRKQNDFKLLNPQVQNLYAQKIQMHEQLATQQAQQLKEAQAQFIPASGPLVKVDFYGKDGKRITIPIDALEDLVQKLEKQGLAQESLQQLDVQNQLNILGNQQGMSEPVGMQQSQMSPYSA